MLACLRGSRLEPFTELNWQLMAVSQGYSAGTGKHATEPGLGTLVPPTLA